MSNVIDALRTYVKSATDHKVVLKLTILMSGILHNGSIKVRDDYCVNGNDSRNATNYKSTNYTTTYSELFTFLSDILDDSTLVSYGFVAYPVLGFYVETTSEKFVISSNTLSLELFDMHRSIVDILRTATTRTPMSTVTIEYTALDPNADHNVFKEYTSYDAASIPSKPKTYEQNGVTYALMDNNPTVKPKGYTNVVVGNEFEPNPVKRQRNIIAEVMQHVDNVAKDDVRVAPTPEKALDDLHINAGVTVDAKAVEEHRKKVFAQGLEQLAQEAKRKEAESTEDDFAV